MESFRDNRFGPQVSTHLNPSYDRIKPEDTTWTDSEAAVNFSEAWFGTVYDLAKSLEFAISGIETFVNASEFMDEWYLGNYFDSGFFLGSGVSSSLFIFYDFFAVYVDNLLYQMSDDIRMPVGE